MFTLKEIASILHSGKQKLPNVVITTLLTDSRKVAHTKSSLFFALPGPRRDGHQFIPELYNAGVRYFVISENMATAKYPGAVFFKVEGVLDALQKIVVAHRNKFSLTIIGITGSNGKTIVKEWLYQLLQPQYNIVRSPKSYNSQIGVPLSVWETGPADNLAIFEAGISQPGEMKKLEPIIQPNIGVLTNIGAAHSEGFKSDQEKLREKLNLFIHSSVIIFNGDNEMVKNGVAAINRPSFSWGKQKHNPLRITSIKRESSASKIKLACKKQIFEIEIPFTDDASLENAITCCAVLVYMEVDTAVIQERMKTLQPVNMRLEYKKGINNCIIINDSYSADTDSLSIALDFLKQQAKGLKKTVILSDFLQSGDNTIHLYSNILEQLQKHNISRFIGIGEQMLNLVPQLIAGKKLKIAFSPFLTTEDLLRHLHTPDFKDEAILIKGARLFGFEEIAAQLEQKAHQTILEINLNAIAHN
ncbi:MAG TPA: UDP-N-acetylmuramoyl-tripeptide--D-alanyl-D-alanine ligase [Niabella sp.]|nr:UDP-N-acetylmuramoyl-tripeptide--D-alanyl-D-alanine ligase [Niabella sp.]